MGTGPVWVLVVLPLCLLPGRRCEASGTTTEPCNATGWNGTNIPPASRPPSPKPPVVVVPTRVAYQRLEAQGAVAVEAGPPSVTVTEGSPGRLDCRFQAPPGAQVTWSRVCSGNCSELLAVLNISGPGVAIDTRNSVSSLVFHRARKNDTGLYFCQVQSQRNWAQSCGTYLRVRKPAPVPFLNMRESTKNQLITAEGILLLLCAVGPGLVLLFRKRWENERLLQAKQKAYEEENLYEGLNLDECSMYEDISRGLQATYQDVANIRVLDMQLEKP